jgi:hypothetical protein
VYFEDILGLLHLLDVGRVLPGPEEAANHYSSRGNGLGRAVAAIRTSSLAGTDNPPRKSSFTDLNP